MIRNIILDIGDVLVKSNYRAFFAGKGYDEQTISRLEKATFFSPAWKELDRGEWSFARIIDAFVKNDPELEGALRTVFDDMSGFVTAFPYAVDWVRELKESGLKVFCLSNISDKICRDCESEMEFLKHTDGYILSYREKLIKPDPAIFRLLLERYGLSAEECVFVDDIEQNVNAARALGIHGIVFHEKAQADNEIEMLRRRDMNKLGFWNTDKAGLPCFEYTGEIPYAASLSNGTAVKLPDDPWFLLGNYRLTLFAHVSGEYELISGQRSWARINQGKKRNSGVNSSVITVDGKDYPLTGMDSLAADAEKCGRVFGVGFANYSYELSEVTVNRNLSVKPSTEFDNGASAFLLTVTIRNGGGKRVDCAYSEYVGANFEPIQFQTAKEWLPLKYTNEYSENRADNSARVTICAQSRDPLLAPERETISKHDAFPPLLFVKALSENAEFSGDENGIAAAFSFSLEPNEEKAIGMIIGFSFEYGFSTQDGICAELSSGRAACEPVCAFADEWLKIIPDFDSEKDETLRRELRWHVYNLEAMATYSEYYNETKIPQGTIYDYDWGCHASARDNFQHALPLVYYNPKLAKSVLKYMLKRTTPFGEIRLIEMGNGYADNERYFTSDQQLYFFLLLSEYLRVTEDYAFLCEKVQPYPAKNQTEMTVADFAEKCFVFLRDTIGTGSHGLVKLLNSDWNDAVYYIEKVPYNNIFLTGESHMNSAMAISIFQTLIPQLKKAAKNCEKLSRLCESMTLYRKNILDAFLNDMGERDFPRRMYFNGKPYGDDNMFLEPQGFTLQINELSEERKRRLYEEMKRRVYSGEKLGAREQQAPEFEDEGFDKGSRENGGFWYALNGPVIIGVSQFDKAEAKRLLKDMTLDNLSEKFPQFWSSYWSAADNVESSLIPEEGLPDQSLNYANIPVYCAHPHAWILYCYYRITE